MHTHKDIVYTCIFPYTCVYKYTHVYMSIYIYTIYLNIYCMYIICTYIHYISV